MSNTRTKLDRMAEAERRNAKRIDQFNIEAFLTEHRRERLALIEGYTREKPGFEGVREKIIARYRQELKLDKEA